VTMTAMPKAYWRRKRRMTSKKLTGR
jgi:hypothetical protein